MGIVTHWLLVAKLMVSCIDLSFWFLSRTKGAQETRYREQDFGSSEQKFRDLQGGAQAQSYQVSGRDKPHLWVYHSRRALEGNNQIHSSNRVTSWALKARMNRTNVGFKDLMLDCTDLLTGWCQNKMKAKGTGLSHLTGMVSKGTGF